MANEPLVTFYPPRPLPGGEVGICAMIRTSQGPIRIMVTGERKMLTDVQARAVKFARLVAANGAASAWEAFAGRPVIALPKPSKSAIVGARRTSANFAFDLAHAFAANSKDARAKVRDAISRSRSGDEGARRAMARIKMAHAANKVVLLASNGDQKASSYVEDLQDRAENDEHARARFAFIAAARARMMMRPMLAWKSRAAEGDMEAAQNLAQAMRASPELVDVVNSVNPDSVYAPEDVQAQDSSEYGDVSGEVGAVLRKIKFSPASKDNYGKLRSLLTSLFNGRG